MAFSKFTLKQVKQELQIQVIENEHLFAESVPIAQASDYLQTTLAEFSPLALSINTEKSRSEWIVAPVLADLRRQLDKQVSLFSGISWSVAPERGLDGYCDYIISADAEQFYLVAPVVTIVEAKKENIVGGLGQCIATMYAAALFNQQEGHPIQTIYGAVTTGTNWKFLKLQGQTAWIDIDEYFLENVGRLLGILRQIVQPISPLSGGVPSLDSQS
ncbi:MAG: hypothetical protein AAFZ80_07400 [Cyanobacteria bacterium P01_A01_bin.105]